MHAGLRTAVLTLCLVTAGCTGLFGSPTGTSVETVTPAPVPDSPPELVAPGLTATGVSNSTALVRAHVDQVSSTSFTVQHRRLVVDENGTILRRRYTRAETNARDQRNTVYRRITGRSVVDREIRMQWTNDTVTRLRDENDSTRRAGTPRSDTQRSPFLDLTFRQRLRAVFVGVNVTSVVPAPQVISQLHGARVLRVNADGAKDASQLPTEPADRVVDVGFTATVTPAGFVHSYSVGYTVVRDGDRRRITESLWYSDVSVREPRLDGENETASTDL